jgi:hypothetical protein
MKNIRRYSLMIAAAFAILVSCRDDDWAPYPDWNDHVGAATKLVINPARNSFRLSQGIANEYFEFNLNVDGYDLTTVTEVELMFTFTEASPARANGPFVLKRVNTFPSDVQITAAEAAAAIATARGTAFTVNDFQAGDRFDLTFPMITDDGRRLTVATNSELCTNAAQPMFQSCTARCNVVN